jgi:hypothetical protein
VPPLAPAAAAGNLAASAAAGQQGSKVVFVTGLPAGIDERQLTELFQLCGPVEHARAPGENVSIIKHVVSLLQNVLCSVHATSCAADGGVPAVWAGGACESTGRKRE